MTPQEAPPVAYVDIRIQPGETPEQFADRVVMTAPVLSSEVQVRLRQLLPPVPLVHIEDLGRAS